MKSLLLYAWFLACMAQGVWNLFVGRTRRHALRLLMHAKWHLWNYNTGNALAIKLLQDAYWEVYRGC